jgi:hypothetical protein
MPEPIETPSTLVEAIDGLVVLNGPEGLVFTLSALVARDLSTKLRRAAAEAEVQRRLIIDG